MPRAFAGQREQAGCTCFHGAIVLGRCPRSGPARLAGPTIGRCATRDRDWELLDNLRPKLSIKSNNSRDPYGNLRSASICWTRPPRIRIWSNNSTAVGASGYDILKTGHLLISRGMLGCTASGRREPAGASRRRRSAISMSDQKSEA